jgi:hypothetical protein
MKCVFIKPDDVQCNANAMSGAEFCYTHNPTIPEDERHEARTRGGKANIVKVANPLSEITINKPSEVVDLLTDTIQEVRRGNLDPRIANTIGYLAGHLLKAFEVTKVADRVETIERVILERRTH